MEGGGSYLCQSCTQRVHVGFEEKIIVTPWVNEITKLQRYFIDGHRGIINLLPVYTSGLRL